MKRNFRELESFRWKISGNCVPAVLMYRRSLCTQLWLADNQKVRHAKRVFNVLLIDSLNLRFALVSCVVTYINTLCACLVTYKRTAIKNYTLLTLLITAIFNWCHFSGSSRFYGPEKQHQVKIISNDFMIKFLKQEIWRKHSTLSHNHWSWLENNVI